MKFEEVLPLMRQGQWFKRQSWHENYPVIQVSVADNDFVFEMNRHPNVFYHWGFDDLLASDWVAAPVESETEEESAPKKRGRKRKDELVDE